MDSLFTDANAAIVPLDAAALDAARRRWNAVAKPIGGLGVLESMVEQVAGLTGSADVALNKRMVVVMCADNGVVAQGVSQCGAEVTGIVAASIARGASSVCAMARACRAQTVAVDMGMLERSECPGIIDARIGAGTADITQGPAMTRAQAAAAVEKGMALVGQLRSEGVRIVVAGEMGIGNTTTSSAMAAAFLGLSAADVTGRGAGLSDAGLARKTQAVERALKVNAPDAGDPLDVLAKLGGFDIAGMVGLFIGGAVHRVPVVMDGFISTLAAYTAIQLCPACACAILPSHVSAEPAAALLLERMGMQPPIHAGLHLGEGTGAVLLLPMLDAALELYGNTTFDAAGIEPYEADPR